MYYLQTRYYDPETGRFINADGVIAAVDDSVQGYNMFAYCFNNPINMNDPTGHWPKWVKNMVSTITNTFKKIVDTVSKVIKPQHLTSPPANHVTKKHITTPKATLDLGPSIGKVGLSSTATKQNKTPGLFHSYSDVGNDKNNYGVGVNVNGQAGVGVGVNSEISVFAIVQLTPWLHGEASVGLKGVGASIGFDVGNMSYDFDVTAGWWLIAIFVAPNVVSTNGQLLPVQ